MVAVIVIIDINMAFNRHDVAFLLRPRIASWSSSFTAVTCSLGVNAGVMQCYRKRLYDPETRMAPVSSTNKCAHR